MPNEKVEFDLTINGKQAKKSLEEIEKDLEQLEKQDKKTAKSMKADWVAIGAGITAAAVAAGTMITQSNNLARATIGLNKQTKEYIRSMSELTGLNQEIIAGFVQTGKSAGLTGKQIETMIHQSVALARMYPHESVETFIDNLTMLNKTGEAQGYIVDVLEQRYGMVDLKLISTADKLKAVEEATRGVNIEGTELDKSLAEMSNTTSMFGSALMTLVEESGLMWLFKKALLSVSAVGMGFVSTIQGAKIGLKQLFGADTKKDMESYEESLKKVEEIMLKLTGQADETAKPSIVVSKGQLDRELSDLEKFKNKVAALKKEMKTAVRDARITPEQFLFGTAVIDEWATEVQTKISQGLSMEQAVKNSLKDLKTITDAVEDSSKEWADFGRGAVNTMTSAFTEFAMTGKLDMKKMAQSIIADLIRVMIQIQMVNAIRASGFGAFFGLHTGGEVKHTGGMIGGGSHIPSYHTGMRSDERMAKLQVGESVVNRAGTAKNGEAIDAMNRGQKIGGGSNVVINIENNTGAPMTAEQSTSTSSSGGIEQIVKNITLKLANTDSQFRSVLAGAR